MKFCLSVVLLLASTSVMAAPVNVACDAMVKQRTADVMALFTDGPATPVTVVSSVYKSAPLEVIDGDIAKGETYKVYESVQVGEGKDAVLIPVESGVIAPNKHFKDCQVLYTSPGKVNK